MVLENFKSFDPFADAGGDGSIKSDTDNYIHIRIQQRNGRKSLTTIQGLEKLSQFNSSKGDDKTKLDNKKVLKELKKLLATNGNVIEDEKFGKVLQLQGDQRVPTKEFLVDALGVDIKLIKIHGH